MVRVLILGGTSEAAALAASLDNEPSFQVITSLAGRTAAPKRLPGETRIGGFGGVQGLAAFARARQIDAVIDATHPFAAQMSRHALQACADLAIPRLRLVRPAWTRHEEDGWHEVPDGPAAAAMAAALGSRVFLTSGHKDLAAFAMLDDLWFLIRSIEPLGGSLPKKHHWLQARGPFSRADEIQLMRQHRIDLLVTKASGGSATYAKIEAARQLHLPVLMITRPPAPPGPTVHAVDDAIGWLESVSKG